MNILKALKLAKKKGMWIRPKSWGIPPQYFLSAYDTERWVKWKLVDGAWVANFDVWPEFPYLTVCLGKWEVCEPKERSE